MADDATSLDPDDLWTVAPAQFVEERNRVVRALRASGDRTQAKEVSSWRKPSVVEWSLNVAAHEAPEAVVGFVEAARAAIRAQEAATSRSGAGPAPSLRDALADLRRAESALAEAAAAVAKRVGGDQRAAIAARLRELAGQEPLVEQLRQGRLGAPLAEDFDEDEPVASPQRPAARTKAGAPKAPDDSKQARAAAAKAHRDAVATATKAHREAAGAAKALRQAEDRAGAALGSRRSAEAEVDRLETELATAQSRVEREQGRTSEAEAALEEARARAADADEAAAAADRAAEAAARSTAGSRDR